LDARRCCLSVSALGGAERSRRPSIRSRQRRERDRS